MTRLGFYLRAGVFFLVGVAVGTLLMQRTSAQEKSANNGLKLLVVGIAVKDYPESQNFYEKLMGLKTAFKFSPDGTRTTTYYQLGRDSFIEMQSATPAMPEGLSHVHLLTDNLNATVARLRQAGMPGSARTATTPGTVTEIGMVQPANVRSANVFDPNGIRIELNEWLPDSLTKKAMDSWK
jgi:catechol 2,3-dioxygenase-like lactoylglutathione lyase family enzyme